GGRQVRADVVTAALAGTTADQGSRPPTPLAGATTAGAADLQALRLRGAGVFPAEGDAGRARAGPEGARAQTQGSERGPAQAHAEPPERLAAGETLGQFFGQLIEIEGVLPGAK